MPENMSPELVRNLGGRFLLERALLECGSSLMNRTNEHNIYMVTAMTSKPTTMNASVNPSRGALQDTMIRGFRKATTCEHSL